MMGLLEGPKRDTAKKQKKQKLRTAAEAAEAFPSLKFFSVQICLDSEGPKTCVNTLEEREAPLARSKPTPFQFQTHQVLQPPAFHLSCARPPLCAPPRP